MEKVGLYITTLLHDLTQMGYTVTFGQNFEGTVTITYGGMNTDWRDHQHVGIPGATREHLEKEIINSLKTFKEIKELELKQTEKS